MLFSKIPVLPAIVSVLVFSASAAAADRTNQPSGDGNLGQYLRSMVLLQEDPPYPFLWEGKSQKGGPQAGWEDLNPGALPAPLDRRARFLKAWFRSPDIKLTEEGLSPALSAFPDLAPLLLWHLSHSYDVKAPVRKALGSLAAGMENNLFAPSDRPEGADGRARDLFAQAMEKSGKERSALLGQLVSDHPLSPESGLALAELGPSNVDSSLLIRRWSYLQKMGANDLVVRETKAYLATSPSFPSYDWALYLEARSLALLGHTRKSRALIREALDPSHRILLRSEFLTLHCRILLSEDFPRGERCLDGLFRDYPRAAFLPTYVLLALRQDLVHPLPKIPERWKLPSSFWTDPNGRLSAWVLGLDEALRGNGTQALGTWRRLSRWLLRHPPDSDHLLPRVLYFMARVESRADHRGLARSLYRQVLRHGEETPYALWAAISCRNRCGTFHVGVHHPSRTFQPPAQLRRAMEELFQMGLFGPALVLERMYMSPEMDRDQISRYGDLDLAVSARDRLILVDQIFPAHGTGFRLPSGEWMSASILTGFRESGVPTLWALSIARQESRFQERSLSVDGALGVMQLMPRTALAVVDHHDAVLRHSIGGNLGMIRHPGLNSLIGGLYLKRLIDSVPGHPERAIAGYNAGLHAVMSWKRLSDADWDFFTEAIPYQETRRYVREVLWNYAYLQRHLAGRKGTR